jgi:hypothetical protein
MRFREAIESDIPAIAAAFGGRNALPLEPHVRAALPVVLSRMIASPACVLTVFEGEDRSGLCVLSFAGGLFLREAIIEDYLAAPNPGLLSGVLAALLNGQQPLLTLEEIRQRNSSHGLTLAVFPIPLGRHSWDDPLMEELRRLAPPAFVRAVGGYRIRAIYYEVFMDEVATYVQAGGYRLLHDFSGQAGTGLLGPDCRPRMLRLTASDLPPGAMSMASQMFNPPDARLGLTQAEQRVALRALEGASDRTIATSLGLSTETVRSNWRSIYWRLAKVLPEFETHLQHAEHVSRGLEKRRVAIEYLRQNMHELRPTIRSSRSSRPRLT